VVEEGEEKGEEKEKEKRGEREKMHIIKWTYICMYVSVPGGLPRPL
jgi:hypothetical protein